MAGDEGLPQAADGLHLHRGCGIGPIDPHPPSVVHPGEVMAVRLGPRAVPLVDALVEGLGAGRGGPDVAEDPGVIEEPVDATRIAGRFGGGPGPGLRQQV
jgi:hypothetical protein